MFDLDQLTAIQRPTIRKKPWMEKKNFVLVTTETIAKVVDECIKSGYYALDLETTGLDNRAYNNTTIDHIVGACISPDGETGYYLPLLHTDYMDKCIPNSVFKREMRRLTSSPAIAIFHNGKFDHEFLQFNGSEPLGEWDDPKVWEDTLILAYIRNTREKRKGLKHLSHTLLDMEMIELNELFSEEKAELDFSTLDPSWPPTLWYAASDAICTFLLYHRLRDEATKPTIDLPSQEPIYVIEKLGVTATRWMERNQIPIDRDKVVELIQLGQREWLPAMGVVFTEVSKALGRDVTPGYYRLLVGEDERFRFNPDDVDLGITDNVNRAVAEAERKRMDPSDLDSKGKIRIHTIQKSMPSLVDKKQIETVEFPLVYDIRNPNQFGLMLRELGVPGLRVTEKSGQIQTTADEIDRVLEEAGDIFPYLAKVRRFREVARAITNNLMPLYKYTAKEFSPNGRIRINFDGQKVDTARFSTPKSTERKGWTGRIPWNIHSVPSGKKKDIPECLKRIRECIKAEKGSIIVAVDFSGQELRVVTNLSREPMWENEFFRCSACGHTFDRGGQVVPPIPEAPPPYCPECGSDSIGDIHTLTAQALYGADVTESPDFKEKRGNSKGVNFALCYGGGGMAVVRAAGVSKDEGWRIKRQFDNTYKVLAGWWGRQHDFARRTKHVLTAFNRRYPLPDIDSADGGFRAKAERNAVNGPIQSTGADIMKYSMGLIYRECKKRGWLDLCKIIITMHDEIVFEIAESIFVEALEMIKYIMLKKCIERLPWRVPLTCDIEAGIDWTVPWNVTKIQHGKQKMPDALKHVLAPVTVTKETTESSDGVVVSSDGGQMAGVANPLPTLGKGEDFVYVIRNADLTMRTMNKLAEVIHRCRGRGEHTLRIRTEDGHDLWEGELVKVNAGEFSVLINMPRL